MPFPPLFRWASRIAGGAVATARACLPAGVDRRVRVVRDCAYIEIHGIHRPGTEDAARELVKRLTESYGVRTAEVNAALSWAVVTFDHDKVKVDDLVLMIREVEEAHAMRAVPHAARGQFPGPAGGMASEAIALGVDLLGLPYAFAGRLLPLPKAPTALSALVAVADYSPRVRGCVEGAVGRPAADALFALTGSVANAMAQVPLLLVNDAWHRGSMIMEGLARQRSWEQWHRALADREGAYDTPPLDRAPRPVPLPAGATDRVADVVTSLGTAGAGATLLGNRQRALGVLVSSAPRAARMGREAFAGQLGRGIARRRVLTVDPDALRRLDRVDMVVLDAAILRTGEQIIDEIVPVDSSVALDELHARAHELVHPAAPDIRRERDGWSVVPVADDPLGADARVREWTTRGALALALRRGVEVVGLVSVVTELDPLAEALVSAARAAGAVVVAGADGALEKRLDADRWMPGDVELVSSVRALQADGHVVAVVSAHRPDGLAAADVGIGIAHADTPPPWGSSLLCGPGLGEACLLLQSVPFARKASRRSAQMAIAGATAGSLLSMLGPAQSAPGRAQVPVQVAALLALAAGTWWGTRPMRMPAPVPVTRTPWHAMPANIVLDRLGTSPDGLDAEEAARRRQGRPDQEAVQRAGGVAETFLEELDNPVTPVLAGSAGLSWSVGSMIDTILIVGVLGLNALVGGTQRLGADRALHRLTEAVAMQTRLRRGEQRLEQSADQLVLGDVVELDAGDAVPADCRLLVAQDLEVDESSLTGESQVVSKTVGVAPARVIADRHCMLYQGTVVAAGSAVAVVTAVGTDTEIGRTTLMGGGPRSGGVHTRLNSLVRLALPISVGAGVTLLGIDALRGRPIAQALGRAVSLAVAAVPEGLPFVATVAQLAAARRLSRHGALVRNPSTMEALGRVDVLCFDKTGTLTEGRIRLHRVSDGFADRPADDLTPALRRVVGAALRASPVPDENRPLAHPTDRAVVDGAIGAGVGTTEGAAGWELVDSMPFEPARGFHAVLGHGERGLLVSVKGAPEIVFARCSHWRRPKDGDGMRPFDDEAHRRFSQEVTRLASRGYRVLAVAEHAASDGDGFDDDRVRGLCLTGLLALADPVRPTALRAVEQLRQAGVRVVMVTGDHPDTAEAIGTELNVVNGDRIMTGSELDAVDDAELARQLPNITVFARVSPAQKARIVRVLRTAGRVVAVTGDGANDAPAIRLADVGMALGRHATPAARHAADVVITDDRIETITAAIVEGRAMWASVRDAVAIPLGGNLSEIAFTVGTGLLSAAETLNARQLLLINVLTDVLPAMAIALRPPPGATAEVLLAEGPDASLGPSLTRDIYRRATITTAATSTAWVLGRFTGTRNQANTAALVALVGAQLGQTLAAGRRDRLVLVATVLSFAALAAIVQTPGVSHFFGSRPLWPHGWTIAVGTSVAAALVSLALRSRRTVDRRAIEAAG
ncbi:cation-translocating P-type ATPase [Kutzneria buriramensis]|uniref:Cation-transporting ATPase I n=1 Tax=Kutzneria buriramensis TaxID=1045776 RepID=A0A3E0H408_9PSEU|nr:cation-translocating P-type ATPase [Kutzneria buriramensis]REH37998.1 cation-transporting ATPase I [Kutzneria buriramensis]